MAAFEFTPKEKPDRMHQARLYLYPRRRLSCEKAMNNANFQLYMDLEKAEGCLAKIARLEKEIRELRWVHRVSKPHCEPKPPSRKV